MERIPKTQALFDCNWYRRVRLESRQTDEGCSAWPVGSGVLCGSIPDDCGLLTALDRIIVSVRQSQETVESGLARPDLTLSLGKLRPSSPKRLGHREARERLPCQGGTPQAQPLKHAAKQLLCKDFRVAGLMEKSKLTSPFDLTCHW